MKLSTNNSLLVSTYSFLTVMYGGFIAITVLTVIMFFVSIVKGFPFLSYLELNVGISVLDPQLRNLINPDGAQAFLVMNEGELVIRNPSLGVNFLSGLLHLVYFISILMIITNEHKRTKRILHREC